MTYTVPDFGPNDLLTSDKEDVRRIKTQNSSEAFEDGRGFRLPYEYSLTDTPVVLRFVSAVDFMLSSQTLICDQGNIRLDAYRDGTESGIWTTVPTFKRNIVDNQAYVGQVIVSTGGAITPITPSVDIIRVRTSGATAQQSNVSEALNSSRKLSAGTYYLQLSRIDGNDVSTGVYLIEWEEL